MFRNDPRQGDSGRTFRKERGENQVRRQEKVELVERLSAQLAGTTSFLLAEYRGLTVEQMTDLRARVRGARSAMRVVKNTFLRRAVSGTDKERIAELMEGPNAVILVQGDIVDAIKVAAAADKEFESFRVKGGVIEGRAVGPDEIRQIAELPPRAELLGRAVGSLASPMRGLLNVCTGTMRNLVYALEAVRQAKEKQAA